MKKIKLAALVSLAMLGLSGCASMCGTDCKPCPTPCAKTCPTPCVTPCDPCAVYPTYFYNYHKCCYPNGYRSWYGDWGYRSDCCGYRHGYYR